MSWGADKRSYNDELVTTHGTLLESIMSFDNLTDEKVTVRQALKIATVYTCVTVPAMTISSLPLNVIKESNGKKEVLTDHKVYYGLAHEPNAYMSSANFWVTLIILWRGWGNAYARITRDSRQNPVAYDIMEPSEVTHTYAGGNLYYHYQGEAIISWDVLHFRSYSFDGVCGRSAIMENSTTMGMAIKLDRYASLILGSQPPGVLSYKGNLNPTQLAENRKIWQSTPSGSVKVLGGDWLYQPIMTPGDETQFNVTKSRNQQEIYGIFEIPPTFAQNFENATYANAEQCDLIYAKHTIMPIIRIIEQECNMKLFFEREKANTYVKFNLNGLLRGDLAARQAFYQTMINTGIMKRNEARGLEDMNGYEGGDIPLVQGAMIPGDQEGIDALRKKMQTDVIPTAAPVNTKLNGHAHSYQ